MRAKRQSVPSNLQEWLTYIARVHPREIDLGLERVRSISEAISLVKPPTVVTVAGTNGKGSVVAVMEQILCQTGVEVGAYTSPHIHRFNERIRLRGLPCDDDLICEAFSQIDSFRGGTSLSYFEFATLAALWIFHQKEVSVALLEVGLGGRLDAVNIIDPDVSVITAIGLDHQDWLGDNREAIGLEKAGILRAGGIFVCGDPDPPLTITQKAKELSCLSVYQGQQFGIKTYEGCEFARWRGVALDGRTISTALPEASAVLPINASTALQALASSGMEQSLANSAALLASMELPGRQELTVDRQTAIPVLLDVAHNTDSIDALVVAIRRLVQPKPAVCVKKRKVRLVIAVMSDKDVETMLASLVSIADIWYISQVEDSRCLPAKELGKRLKKLDSTAPTRCFDRVAEAYQAACDDAVKEELVVVAGSFHTVAAARVFCQTFD